MRTSSQSRKQTSFALRTLGVCTLANNTAGEYTVFGFASVTLSPTA